MAIFRTLMAFHFDASTSFESFLRRSPFFLETAHLHTNGKFGLAESAVTNYFYDGVSAFLQPFYHCLIALLCQESLIM